MRILRSVDMAGFARIALFCLLWLSICGYASADTVILKSGKRIECRILEKTAEYIKIEYRGGEIYYELKTVKEIIPAAPATEPAPVSTGPVAADGSSFDTASAEPSNTCESGNACFMAGVEKAASGRFDLARSLFAEGARIDPDNEDLLGAGALLEAVDQGRVSRDFAVSVFSGTMAMLQREYGKAVESFRTALDLDPRDRDVRYNLALALQSAGDYKAAAVYLRQAVEQDIEDAQAYCLLGIVYRKLGSEYQARECLAIARKLFEKHGDSRKAEEVTRLIEASM